jgi:polyribonucleotide nucleotidyltransferase
MHGVNEKSVSVELDGGQIIHFSTGKYAKQADGAVVVSCGDSSVLVTAVCTLEPSRFDFLPLTVDFQDKDGARGTIPGGFLKREGRATERTTLIARTIDRPIRPLFPKHFRNETQVIVTSLSYDQDMESDVLGLCGAAAALHISHAPIAQAAAGVRVCVVDGELKLNPTFAEREKAELTIVVAGTADAVTMVEGGGNEVSEALMIDAIMYGHDAIKALCAGIDELREKAGVAKMEVPPASDVPEEIVSWMFANGETSMVAALAIPGKHERGAALKAARNELIAGWLEGQDLGGDAAGAAEATEHLKEAWSKLLKKVMRSTVISEGRRIDGRAPDEIRDIWCEVGIAPRAHGSAVFTRGETQGFVTAALGTDRDAQRIDWPGALDPERTWMLTYNFPPFCTGEARPLRAPKRREIGHGALAHRAIEAVLPKFEEFPYVLRCTSDILESNGSSSMATVCGATLSLLDAGVPLKAPVAGIAMGLVKEGEDYAVLSDILGDEDHLGDMDFKVTGTTEGITAFQMDVKIAGIDKAILTRALAQAREGRLHILDEMGKTLGAARGELSQYAPRIHTMTIKEAKIRELIGPGGKTIRGIQDATGVKINVDDSGRVQVASNNQEAAEKAIAMIREICQEAEIGKLYMGVVKRIVDFGAFVEIFPGTDGLVHISHLAKERVNKVTDVIAEGDEILVRVIDVDRSGKIRLSRKEAMDAGL